MQKEIRALIRDRRRNKQPYEDLLHALYGSALMADVTESLKSDGLGLSVAPEYVSVADLVAVKVDYTAMGYHAVKALSKTDVKWLVERFGEPAEHESVASVWPAIRQNAIRRYCWQELNSHNKAATSLGLPEQTMRQWLHEIVKRHLGYRREWEERVATRVADLKARDADDRVALEAAWAALNGAFVVADIETTGLRPEMAEVLEVAALLVQSDGTVLSELNVLVRPQRPVPPEITALTGITQELAVSQGMALEDALSAFLAHVSDRPVFFHNAPFDRAFLAVAAKRSGKEFANKVYDTLPLARQAWPEQQTYRLAALAQRVKGRMPTHRALADARATLDVLLAARRAVS